MQILKFVSRFHGVKNEKPYDFTKVSDGLDSFLLSNAEGIGQKIDDLNLSKGDEFKVEVHISQEFDSLRGTIVKVVN